MTVRPSPAARALLAAAGLGFFVGACGGARAEPARYALDPAHSWVQFEIVHFATATIRGRFGPAQGVVTLDRAARRGEVDITMPTASVSTGLAPFDAHLRGSDLLATAEHPNAWFVARQFTFDGDALRSVRGEFTLRGVSSPLTLTARRFNCYTHPRLQREVCGGDFEGEITRSDFGIDYGLPFVANRVVIKVGVEGIRQD